MRPSRIGLWVMLLLFVITGCKQENGLKEIKAQLSGAEVTTTDNNLIVSTGKVKRTWALTHAGLRTISLENSQNGLIYYNSQPEFLCDWAYYGLLDDQSRAKLISLSAAVADDEGFTSEHIRVEAEFEYPEVETFVKYVIWVYPGAPGIRTQLFIKGNGAKYLSEAKLQTIAGVEFNLVQGRLVRSYKAAAYTAASIAASTQDSQRVEYHIKGLDRGKKYTIGFTWWDFDGDGISQNVWVTSVDGEKKSRLLEKAELPNFKRDQAPFGTKILDLPSEVLMDGSFRILFEKINGKKAVVSEIFLYEEAGAEVVINNGLEERIAELKQSPPSGTTLVGYVDCGVPITGDKLIPTGRVDYIPVNTKGFLAKFIGYYNDTQHRNKPETPLVKEVETELAELPIYNNWSNLVGLHKNNKGLVIVKESHKCANQYGVDTGGFELTPEGISNTGTSLFPQEILRDEYSWCWASWAILYDGGQDEMELAIKEFDRARYPVDTTRDIYIQSNTWGSDHGREASKEENVLIELESQKELGIDIQQIDDGWQSAAIPAAERNKGKANSADLNWQVRDDWYPEGWKRVVAKSDETGVKLGLWAAAQPITLEALKWNYDQAGFVTYKLDFADLGTHRQMDDLMKKIRSFVNYTNHKVRVNWDVTENAPRYGYFWAKEYGCIYLENRKPKVPGNAVYVPSLVLRDIWQLSKYTNVNRFQTSIQNIDRVDRVLSDAYLYNHPYAVAIGLVGTPLFFQETHLYSGKAKEEIKALLARYKAHRENMYQQYVFPVGEEPNNGAWTGFQWINANFSEGYLMVFRELNNPEAEKRLPLRFLRNKRLQLSDVMTGLEEEVSVGSKGEIGLKIAQKADFRFYHFKVLK